MVLAEAAEAAVRQQEVGVAHRMHGEHSEKRGGRDALVHDLDGAVSCGAARAGGPVLLSGAEAAR